MQKRNSRTPLLVFPGTELSGHQQSAADYGSKTPTFFHFRNPSAFEKLGAGEQ
jgi:hypothetical protein